MKLSTGLQNFWILFASYGLGCLIALGITLLGYGWRSGLAVAVGLGLAGWLGLAWMKDRLLRSVSGRWAAQSVVLQTLVGYDFGPLVQQTQVLEALGFLHLEDYTLPGTGRVMRSFCHPGYQCFAEIGQGFDGQGQPRLVPIVVFSPLEQGWLLADVGRSVERRDSWAYVGRSGREVRRYRGDAIGLEALLAEHVRLRQRMMEELRVAVVSPLSWELYRELQQELVRCGRRGLRQRSLVRMMLEATGFEWRPVAEWWGEYGPGRLADGAGYGLEGESRPGTL